MFTWNSLYPSSWFGNRTRRAVLGTGGGKFGTPLWSSYGVNQKTILINGSYMDIAMMVPHLNTVISTGAELFSMMKIKHVDKEGEEIENSPIVKFLANPNPLQTGSQYQHQFYVLNSVYNKTFQHLIKGLSFDQIPKAMWLLPSGCMKIITTGKMYRQSDIKEIISNYELNHGQVTETFEVDNVLYMTEGIGENILDPVSRIEAMKIPLSNIVASLKSRNIIVSQRGAIGMLSRKAGKDSDGFLPGDANEKEKIETQYQKNYDLDSERGHVIITSEDYQWNAMTFDIKQLALSEGIEDDFSAIIAAYRHDRDIYPSIKGATYENKAAGMRSTIQNAIQPLADKLMEQFTAEFIKEGSGEKLVACYDHLPCMQEDERLKAQGKLYKIQGLSIALKDGVISHAQYAQEAELEADGTLQPPTPQPLYAGNQNQPNNNE